MIGMKKIHSCPPKEKNDAPNHIYFTILWL